MAHTIFSVFCTGCAAAYRDLAEQGLAEIIDPADFPKSAPTVNDKGRPVIFAVRGDTDDLDEVSRAHVAAAREVH